MDRLSNQAQAGLRLWAGAVWGDPAALDHYGEVSAAWAWVCFLLRESEDRPEWFPKGKYATIQVIELILMLEARTELGEKVRKP